MMTWGFRLVSPFGSMNRRRCNPRFRRIFVTVRRAMTMPSVPSSKVMREADHFRVRRMDSISVTIPAAVAAGWCIGVLDRSCSPRSPYLRCRLTHLDAHWREIPISAATWAIGRLWHRSTSRRLPSTVSGALRCVTGLVLFGRERLCRNSHSYAEDQPVYFSPASTTSIPTTVSAQWRAETTHADSLPSPMKAPDTEKPLHIQCHPDAQRLR